MIEERALAAAREVAREQGLECAEAAVLHSGSNVLVGMWPAPVVARVMSGTVALHADPERWLRDEVAVMEYLAPSGLAVRPSPAIAAGPYLREGLWMTFCAAVEEPGPSDLGFGAERLGRSLRELHDELAGFPGKLPGFLDLRDDIARLLGLLRPTPELGAETIERMGERLAALGETVFATSLPTQALHGDASLFNLLRGGPAPGRLVWNDFEDTFRGPVHWDLAGFLVSLEWAGADADYVARALAAYGGVEASELAPFNAVHDLYDEIWRAYDAQRRR